MSVNIPNLPVFRSGYKKKPLPLWFQTWISKQKFIRYKDLLVPCVQFKVVAKDDYGSVNVGISIKGKDVYGNILVFPYSWSQGLTTDALQSGFQEKLSRHLNMVSKGCSRGTPKQIKSVIDSTFQVNSVVSFRHPKVSNNLHILLKIKPNGSVTTQSGKIVGASGTAVIKQIINQMYGKGISKKKKKKKRAFNPSRR